MIFKINSNKIFQFLPKTFISPKTINFGFIPDDYSLNSKNFNTSPMSSQPIIGEMSLKKFFKDISNQYSLSSCVANAVADVFEAQQAQKLAIDPNEISNLSRLFIYWNARNLSTPPTTNKDNGCKINFALTSLQLYGVPIEKLYPYTLSKVNDKPGWLVYKKAIQNKITNFYNISSSGESRIIQIKQALAAGCPIVFGTDLYEGFRTPKLADTIKLNTEDKYIGRHCMIITGVSDSKTAFEVRNSWSKNWANKGYCMMDFNYIKSNKTKNLWAVTL